MAATLQEVNSGYSCCVYVHELARGHVKGMGGKEWEELITFLCLIPSGADGCQKNKGIGNR